MLLRRGDRETDWLRCSDGDRGGDDGEDEDGEGSGEVHGAERTREDVPEA